jgi:hypothetical protein
MKDQPVSVWLHLLGNRILVVFSQDVTTKLIIVSKLLVTVDQVIGQSETLGELDGANVDFSDWRKEVISAKFLTMPLTLLTIKLLVNSY